MNESVLSIIGREFNHRHDFNDSDLDVLKQKFPSVSFRNIPQAWIIVIDDLLQTIWPNVKVISQEFGELCIQWVNDPVGLKHVAHAEKRLYMIDADLHLLKEH